MRLTVYDTDDGGEYRVDNVPAQSFAEAVRLLCAKKRWRLIGPMTDTEAFCALDEAAWRARYSSHAAYNLEEDVAKVLTGNLTECVGLLQIFEPPDDVDFADL